MKPMIARRSVLFALAALATPAFARPVKYVLDADASRVGFTYRLSGTDQSGEMPITQADLLIDPADLAASTAEVTVNPARARTGFFFATEALKSAGVLNTDDHPDITFRSTDVTLAPSGRLSDGATLTGDLTVRGLTHPVTLTADLFRPPGTAPDDLSVLTITLTGQLSRSLYGATGYADIVDDRVGLDITAQIRAVT